MGPVVERGARLEQLRSMSASLSNQSETFDKKVRLPNTPSFSKAEILRHNHMLITVNIFSIKGK